ncbi:MAG: CapA family protein [Actinomycetota bacterium]|nr:CapA family protein [Actinomycetota bacterium]
MNPLLGFVGDVMVDRDRPDTAFDPVRGALQAPDLLFGNAECVYTDHPTFAPGAAVVAVAPRHNAGSLGPAGFDVMSLANNHIVDAGHQGMRETAEALHTQGIATVGVGDDLADARTPAVLEVDGVRVAYLAYASFYPVGYEARPDWPGLAPMRSRNFYVEKVPNLWAPGMASHCHAVPVQEDLDALEADLLAARATADVVVASFHWGDYQRPFHLTEHERLIARFAVDHGADIVVGHHHHMLRGVEWYRGKPVFYGLGHFVFDFPMPGSGPAALVEDVAVDPAQDDYYGLAERPGWPLHPWHPDARMTALAWVTLRAGEVHRAGFLPCRLNPQGQVVPFDARSEEGRAVLDYVRSGCSSQELGSAVTVAEDVLFDGLASAEVIAR